MGLHPVAARLLADAAASGRPNAHLLPVSEARGNLTAFYAPFTGPAVARVADVSIPVRDGAIRGRAYVPTLDEPAPLLVFFHGGGWLLGDIDDYDMLARKLTLATGCVVLSVEYRLGPEFRFPTAVDDALAATRWAVANAGDLGADGTRLVLAGESAGGNLATVTAIRCRDEGGPPIAHQLLVYPVTTCDLDIGFDPQYEGMMLYRDELAWHQENYLADASERTNPLVSPLLAGLAGLPSTTVVLAECDPIGVQGRRYAAALAAAGVAVELVEYPGMIHGFFGLDEVFPEAAEAMAFAGRAVRRAVGTDA
jgi:acetyl esterase/lipase